MTTARRALSLARLCARIGLGSLRTPRPRTEPFVSVIIPTYNWSSVLRFAIESVLHQTYGHFELLVVGDCCTDDSEAVVASFGDPRVHWHNLAENSGSQSAPNNAGLERATGEIVAYLGHDDLWLPTHLAHLVTALERSAAAAAWTICQSIGPPGSNVRVFDGLGVPPRPGVPPSAFAHRRDVVAEVGGWRDYRTLVRGPDADFVSRVSTSSRGYTTVLALTVCKFNAAWRRDSYRLRRNEEQKAYSARMQHPRRFVARELAAFLWLGIRAPATSLPEIDPEPEIVPPGWHVTQWRRVRGLPDDP